MDHNTEKILEIVETFVRGINGSQRRGVPWANVPADSLDQRKTALLKLTDSSRKLSRLPMLAITFSPCGKDRVRLPLGRAVPSSAAKPGQDST